MQFNVQFALRLQYRTADTRHKLKPRLKQGPCFFFALWGLRFLYYYTWILGLDMLLLHCSSTCRGSWLHFTNIYRIPTMTLTAHYTLFSVPGWGDSWHPCPSLADLWRQTSANSLLEKCAWPGWELQSRFLLQAPALHRWLSTFSFRASHRPPSSAAARLPTLPSCSREMRWPPSLLWTVPLWQLATSTSLSSGLQAGGEALPMSGRWGSRETWFSRLPVLVLGILL